MTPRVEVADLHLRYGRIAALDGVSFTLDGAGIYGLLGRNGSGKTSLMSVLAAFRKASGGTVLVDGRPVWENPDVTSQICLIGTKVETLGKSDRITAGLDFAARARPYWDDDLAATLLERFGLDRRAKIGALSRGQRSMLGAVLGLAARSPVTMFDEAHLGMDPQARYTFYDALLSDFIEHPRTIILSTHLIEEVGSLFERVLIIDDGRLVLHDDADTLRSQGIAVTGPADEVDRLIDGQRVLGVKSLGPTKSATLHGPVDDAFRDRARRAGLELGPIGLQDLFVHLTRRSGESE
jgi:ABC-2 type transport system ATP-binding protein